MERKDWLLLAVGDRMEPIQLQKALFKFAKESGVPAGESYEFKPYNWGPCSFDIYEDLASMREQGLIEAVPSGRGWSLYRLTERGQAKAEALESKASSPLLERLRGIRHWVTSRDFETLLRDVYQKYPTYSTESLFLKK